MKTNRTFKIIKPNSKKKPKAVIWGHILKHFSLFGLKHIKGKPQICPPKKMYNKYDHM
jgi:nucleoside diphosphate kinase